MTKILGGSVAFEDLNKGADGYPTQKARVELSFELPADYDPTSDTACQDVAVAGLLAQREVARLLGRKVVEAEEPLHPAVLAMIEPAGHTEQTRRPRRTKAQMEADALEAQRQAHLSKDPAAIQEADQGLKDAQSAEPDSATSASATPASTASAEEIPGLSGSSEPSSAGPADMDFSSEPETAAVTDADLNAACQKRAQALGGADKIKTLIGKFAPDPTKPFNLREIPAAQRPDFLAKLEALS